MASFADTCGHKKSLGEFYVRSDCPHADCQLICKLRAELAIANMDVARIDWLADKDNYIGNVQLPHRCVEAHIESLRDMIDCAMKMGKSNG